MSYAPDSPTIRNGLAPAWEFFRAVSGLVAIVALLAVVAGATRLEEPARRLPVAAPAAAARAPEPAVQTPQYPRSSAAQPETMVFYLVATPEQEYEVDWGENVDAFDYARHYRILYARDEVELQAARQVVVEHMLAASERSIVQLIDFRNVR